MHLIENYTHITVAVDPANTAAMDAALQGRFHPGMEIIAWSLNSSDAEIIRRTFETLENDRKEEPRRFFNIEREKLARSA